MKHLIRKQVITLQLDAGQNAFSIQQQACNYYYQHIAPVLEKLFDELSSENEIVDIKRLEVDLGNLGWKNDSLVVDKDSVYQNLKQTFNETLSTSRNSPDPNVSYRSLEENTGMQWLYYMENGVLPWAVQTTDAKWLEQVLHQMAIDDALIQKTKELITNNRWFLARLIREHHEDFLQQLAEAIKVRQFVNQSKNNNETPLKKKEIWVDILKQYAGGKTDLDLQGMLLIEKKVNPKLGVSVDKETKLEGIFCRYAGLVLLHPFFTHLFNNLLLLDNGLFRNNTSRGKAVLLLYFIATGKTEAKDLDLVVPKVLCGMQLYEVIDDDSFVLTEVEHEEALNMMQAAIEQWAIIHNTSPDGLREGFLVREGKFLMKDKGIKFTLESKSIDVLLDHLPWNLSIIKFPWMTDILRVEWR